MEHGGEPAGQYQRGDGSCGETLPGNHDPVDEIHGDCDRTANRYGGNELGRWNSPIDARSLIPELPFGGDASRNLEQHQAGQIVERYGGNQCLDKNSLRTGFLDQGDGRRRSRGNGHGREQESFGDRNSCDQPKGTKNHERRDRRFGDEQDEQPAPGVAQALDIEMGSDGDGNQAQSELGQGLQTGEGFFVKQVETGSAEQQSRDDLPGDCGNPHGPGNFAKRNAAQDDHRQDQQGSRVSQRVAEDVDHDVPGSLARAAEGERVQAGRY